MELDAVDLPDRLVSLRKDGRLAFRGIRHLRAFRMRHIHPLANL
jgi:hypothetical protein